MSDKKEIHSCGNCGRRILESQAELEIYNTRHRSKEYYHESYLGCYESTRETGRRVIYHTYNPFLAAITYKEALIPADTGWTT